MTDRIRERFDDAGLEAALRSLSADHRLAVRGAAGGVRGLRRAGRRAARSRPAHGAWQPTRSATVGPRRSSVASVAPAGRRGPARPGDRRRSGRSGPARSAHHPRRTAGVGDPVRDRHPERPADTVQPPDADADRAADRRDAPEPRPPGGARGGRGRHGHPGPPPDRPARRATGHGLDRPGQVRPGRLCLEADRDLARDRRNGASVSC